jgi:hypothetical protein
MNPQKIRKKTTADTLPPLSLSPGHEIDYFRVGRGQVILFLLSLLIPGPVTAVPGRAGDNTIARLLDDDGDALLQGVENMVARVCVPVKKKIDVALHVEKEKALFTKTNNRWRCETQAEKVSHFPYG